MAFTFGYHVPAGPIWTWALKQWGQRWSGSQGVQKARDTKAITPISRGQFPVAAAFGGTALIQGQAKRVTKGKSVGRKVTENVSAPRLVGSSCEDTLGMWEGVHAQGSPEGYRDLLEGTFWAVHSYPNITIQVSPKITGNGRKS